MSHGNLSHGVPRVVAFHVSWYYTWRGISRTQISWYYTWRCPSCNPVTCKSMVTRQIFKSHTLTFACDTCKLTRVCEVIVELYRNATQILGTQLIYTSHHIITTEFTTKTEIPQLMIVCKSLVFIPYIYTETCF